MKGISEDERHFFARVVNSHGGAQFFLASGLFIIRPGDAVTEVLLHYP